MQWQFGDGWTYVNLSDASDTHVLNVIQEAVEGLGFGASDQRGPQTQDRFVVTQTLLLWIDQTGFVGKMNGLWRLNGASASNLDFVVRDAGRPLNFLIIGEKGSGQFPPGYPGSEHSEFPNRTPEPNDNPSCANRDWCNQYAHEEAAPITDGDIPWWSACNDGNVDFGTIFTPIEETINGDFLHLLYEAPLVKVADGDGNYDGDACGEDWLFPNGTRGTVWLQAGFDIPLSGPFVDRLFRFRNEAGNPPFNGPMSLIGGFVLTTWPNPHPQKALHQWMNPQENNFTETKTGITLLAGLWNLFTPIFGQGDIIFAWMGQPFGISAFPTEVPGRTAILSHIGESDNDDVGTCLCEVHGGLEMGGGVLHGGISLPIGSGETSIFARRRLELPGNVLYPRTMVYDAVDDFQHGTGEGAADGWGAATGFHDANHMLFGPYTSDWCGFHGTANFFMQVDNTDADDLKVVTVDIFDATAGAVLASREITRTEFNTPFVFQDFALDFDATGIANHALEARVYWHDVSFVKVSTVSITLQVD